MLLGYPTALASMDGFDKTPEMLIGFVFVIVVLSILTGITQFIGFFFKWSAARAAAAKTHSAAQQPQHAHSAIAQPAPSAQPDDDISPETLAVITAAIHVTLKRPCRIVAIRHAESSHWAAEGRREISQSHRIR